MHAGSVRALTVAMLALWVPAAAAQSGRTDVVVLANGDHITGEVIRLERGLLEFKTDDAGTLSLEWDKLTSVVVASHQVKVQTFDDRTFFGTLQRTVDRSISVMGADATVTLAMSEVTLITKADKNFWRRLDGSLDVGFNYTRSSGVAQLNVNSDTVYRDPKFRGRLLLSLTQTEQKEDTPGDDRGFLQATYLRYPWRRWYLLGAGAFESNESLGLELRSQIGAAVGPRLVNTNRAQLAIGAGFDVNRENGVDVDPTTNVEALLAFQSSYFTYDRPKTNVDIGLQYYPSLTELGRQRLQFDASAKREFWKDLYLTLTAYDTFDSRPPNPDAHHNDVGVTLAVGWSY